jgi:hypothetical protein
MELDFRTPLQRERDERDEKMFARFKEVRESMPDKSLWLVWRAVGNEFGLHPQGVRSAIERYERKKYSGV